MKNGANKRGGVGVEKKGGFLGALVFFTIKQNPAQYSGDKLHSYLSLGISFLVSSDSLLFE